MSHPTTEAAIAAAEAILGVTFPDNWRDRTRADNGGELMLLEGDWHLYPVEDARDAASAARTARHVVLATREARAKAGFPPAAVAIAENAHGDHLVLLPSPHAAEDDAVVLGETMYAWDHETHRTRPVLV